MNNDNSRRLNDVRPEEWDRIAKEFPAIDKVSHVYERLAEEEAKEDMVNSPDHYTTASGIECIAAIEASMTPEAFKGYCKGNALKYLWRYEKKSKDKSVEDLRKSQWYLCRLIETRDSKSEVSGTN